MPGPTTCTLLTSPANVCTHVCVTSVRHLCASPLCVTSVRHLCASPLRVTSVRHLCAPPLRVTSVRHLCASPLRATSARHLCVPPLRVTSARHLCAPPLRPHVSNISVTSVSLIPFRSLSLLCDFCVSTLPHLCPAVIVCACLADISSLVCEVCGSDSDESGGVSSRLCRRM